VSEDKPRRDLERILKDEQERVLKSQKPDLRAIAEGMSSFAKMFSPSTGSIFPDASYWARFGIYPDKDGYVTAPNGWRMPTAEKNEVLELEELIVKSDVQELEDLYSRKPD
jgi:hypothetical protein